MVPFEPERKDQEEDALLAQALKELLADEGEQLQAENERLLKDPNAAVPADLSRKLIKSIRRTPYKNSLRRLGTVLAVLCRRLLPLLLLAALIWWGIHRFGM